MGTFIPSKTGNCYGSVDTVVLHDLLTSTGDDETFIQDFFTGPMPMQW